MSSVLPDILDLENPTSLTIVQNHHPPPLWNFHGPSMFIQTENRYFPVLQPPSTVMRQLSGSEPSQSMILNGMILLTSHRSQSSNEEVQIAQVISKPYLFDFRQRIQLESELSSVGGIQLRMLMLLCRRTF